MRSTLAAILALIAFAGPIAAEGIRWEPYTYETRDGRTIDDAERGRLVVPEDHGVPDGHTIELSFIRFRTTAPDPGPPIVWLAGGPGDFGSDDIEGPYLEIVRAFQSVADVIALDQRGTGLSEPRLTCPDNVVQLPLDEPLDRDRLVAAYRSVSERCAAYWREQGVDLSTYTTEQNARDIERLRVALGVETISLYGASYGTHLGLAFLREFPQRVHRAVLSGVEGPDHTWKLPSRIDEHFAAVALALGDDDMLERMRRVMARLDHEPVTVTVEGEEGERIDVVVGGFDLRFANQYFLGSLDNIRRLPAIYDAMDNGDFSLLGRFALGIRSVGVGSAMTYCMDCASGASPARLDRITAEAARAGSLVGDALNTPFPDVCDAWPVDDLGEDFRSPLSTDVPVLFLSGTLDGHTPPANVDDLLPGFTRASHVVVENASHQYLELAVPEVRRVMVKFLRGETIGNRVITAPPLVGASD